MRRSLKIPLLIVGGLVAAILLVTGGFLLGARDDLGSAIRGLFPVVSGAPVYGEHYELQQEVLDKIDSTYYKAVDDAKLHEDAIDGMVAGLDDPYTVYWNPDEYAMFKESTSGAYNGVGMSVEMKDHLVTIVSTFKGSPAEEAGIRPGDVITAVNGESVQGLSVDEVVSKIKEGAEGTSVRLEVYRPPVSQTTTTTAAPGQPETTTTTGTDTADVSQLPPGGESKEYNLVRRTIKIPVTETEIVEAGDKKVAVISFYTFSQGSASALRSAVKQAVEVEQVDAVVVDLRSNGGGLLNEGVDVASLFIPEGKVVVSTEGLHSPKQVYTATGGAYTDVPLYVMTDPYTASASEIVAGALKDYDRATIVGETTFGKGLVQSIEPLTNGGALKATTAVYLTPNGLDINKKGISPDVVAPDDPATTEVDETLQAVLGLISGASRSASSTTSTTASTTTTSTSASTTTTVPSTTP